MRKQDFSSGLSPVTVRGGRFVSPKGANGGHLPVLFLNGMGCSLEVLHPIVVVWPRRTVISFDVPGIGGSPMPLIPYGMKTLVSVVCGVMDTFEVEHANLVGVSWGSALAQQTAHNRPHRIYRMTLLAATSGISTGAVSAISGPLTILSATYAFLSAVSRQRIKWVNSFRSARIRAGPVAPGY